MLHPPKKISLHFQNFDMVTFLEHDMGLQGLHIIDGYNLPNIEHKNGHNRDINININRSLEIKNQIIYFYRMKISRFIFLRTEIKIY